MIMNDKDMTQLLATMLLVDWLADDLHYNSRGAGFYEKHLLADRVRDLGDDDAIKEAYWLGFKGANPPDDAAIAKLAILAYGKLRQPGNELEALSKAFDFAIGTVELCKREQELPAGIHAILDGVSEKALTYKFLVSAQK